MNKKNNRKGFTIVELVIVIAVIAILAGVMIPTFGGIIKTAEKSNVLQAATAAYKEAYGVAISDGKINGTAKHTPTGGTEQTGELVETDSEYDFFFVNATSINADDLTCYIVDMPDDVEAEWVVTVSAGVVTVTEKA